MSVAVKQVSASSLSRALGADYARVLNPDAYSEHLVRGSEEDRKSYLASVANIFTTLEDGKERVEGAQLIAGAYAVNGLDTVLGEVAPSKEVSDLIGRTVSAARVSNYRRAAALIFSFGFDPETEGLHFRKLAKECRSGAMKDAMDAKGATKASLLDALSKHFVVDANGQWKKNPDAPAAPARGAGRVTGPEKETPTAEAEAEAALPTRTSMTLVEAIVKSVEALKGTEISAADFASLETAYADLEALLDTVPDAVKAEGRKVRNGK
jgi:hypothetical protein